MMIKLSILLISSMFFSNIDNDITKWDNVINAIIQIESRGDSTAINEKTNAVGAMQIRKIVVDDCNEYLKILNINHQYTYEDRWSVEKSKEMFVLIQRRYNKSNDIEKAVRIWNGGCCYKKKSTDGYYKKFLEYYQN